MLGVQREVIKQEVHDRLGLKAVFEIRPGPAHLMRIKCVHSDVEDIRQNKEDQYPLRLFLEALHHVITIFSEEEIPADDKEERDSCFSEGDKDLTGLSSERPVDRNDQEGHDGAHDIDGGDAFWRRFRKLQIIPLLTRDQGDHILIEAADNGREADRHKDRKEHVHARARNTEDRAVAKTNEEEVMEKVEFQGNGA